MTVEQHQPGNLPVNTEDYATGLEDFGNSDNVTPRLKIVHEKAVFEENLTNQQYPSLRLIILGLVKQRILWHPEVDNTGTAQPMCKSNNFETGYPNLEVTGKKAFPWQASGFDPNTVPLVGDKKPLPCSNCQLKEWGSHPLGSNPYCSEQWTLPVYFDSSGEERAGTWMPALLTLQKSSIKPIKSYLTPFSRGGKPAFTTVCEATLQLVQRGTVDYSLPKFVPVGESNRNDWMEYSEQYAQMRQYLTLPPRSFDEDGEPVISNNINQAPQQQAAPPVQQQPETVVVQQQPVQQPAPPVQDPWTSQPVQQAAPPQQTAPPVQQQPAQQPAPPQQTAPPQQPSGNELPF